MWKLCVGCQSCEITPFEDKSPWRLPSDSSLFFFQMQRDAFANPAGLRPVSGRRFAMLAQNLESSQNRAIHGPSCCPVPVPLQADNACIIKRTEYRSRH